MISISPKVHHLQHLKFSHFLVTQDFHPVMVRHAFHLRVKASVKMSPFFPNVVDEESWLTVRKVYPERNKCHQACAK